VKKLIAGGAPGGMNWLYPYDGTVFARGMLLMWDGGVADVVYLHIMLGAGEKAVRERHQFTCAHETLREPRRIRAPSIAAAYGGVFAAEGVTVDLPMDKQGAWQTRGT